MITPEIREYHHFLMRQLVALGPYRPETQPEAARLRSLLHDLEWGGELDADDVDALDEEWAQLREQEARSD